MKRQPLFRVVKREGGSPARQALAYAAAVALALLAGALLLLAQGVDPVDFYGRMITLGIPGSTVAAVLLGALIMHGLTPGQSMFGKNVTTTYTIIIGFIAANILMGLIGMLICRQVIKITKVSDAILIPVILVLSTIGSYSINNRISDVYMMLVFGLIGYLCKKADLPTAPVILGLLLESTGEQGFKNAILMAKDTPILLYYLQRPASLVLILLIVATVVVPAIQSAIKAVKGRKA